MIIGFTGTRQIERISKERLKKLYGILISYSIDNEDDSLEAVHGCATGADTHFHNLCAKEHIRITGRPSFNSNMDLDNFTNLYYPYSPLIRNKHIVDDCDVLLALPINPDVEELRSGTWSTIRYARKLKKKVIII